jgi:hypothetical protein
MTGKLMLAIFLTSYALGSSLYEAFTRNLGLAAIACTVLSGFMGTMLLWKTAEEQVPED